jgi:glycosyltransferase involved in cell wall biosynthesis
VIDEPEFSVVMPTHSRPQLLGEAIHSVLAQTIADFELIVVDDASDPPACVPADPRIRLVRLEENVGVTCARNIGIATARGRAVAFLDDDDRYTPMRLEFARRGLARAPLTICWARYMGEPIHNNRTLEGDVADTVLEEITPSLGQTALRRDVMVWLDERWEAVEDVDWWLRVAQQLEVTTVPEVGLIVRRHDAERWRNHIGARVQENFELLDAHQAYFDAHRKAASFRLKRSGLLAMQMGDAKRAREAFVRSLWRAPDVRTAWHLLRALRASNEGASGASTTR